MATSEVSNQAFHEAVPTDDNHVIEMGDKQEPQKTGSMSRGTVTTRP